MKAVRWDPASRDDAFAYYAELRRHSPVIRAEIPTRGTGWLVTRYEDVLKAHKDPRFSTDPRNAKKTPLFGFGGPYAPKLIKLVGASMVSVDDPAHARLRRLVSRVFTPRSVSDMAPWIAGMVDTLLDEAAAKPKVDLMADFALPLPLRVISEMLGIPEEWRLEFHDQVVRLIEVNDKPVRRAIRWLPAMPKLLRFFEDLIALKRREPDDKLITKLIAVEEEGDHLSRDELIGMIFLLLFAGHETSVNLIGNGLMALIDHPEQMALLRADPSLMDGAVEEFLRFTNPVEHGTPRFALEDLEIAGTRIRKGEMVILLLAAANRDEAVFTDPDRFDILRKDNGRHLALGFGLHYCLGSSLARLETRIALEGLLRRFPDLALATPRDRIQWRQATGLRGIVSMPVKLGADAGPDDGLEETCLVTPLQGPSPDLSRKPSADALPSSAARGACPMAGHRSA
ncbi:MAG: cytochrome P450 family protein [Janthinobacterium lividum]